MANPLLLEGPLHRVFGAGRVFLTRYFAGIIDPGQRRIECGPAECMPSGLGDPLAWCGLLLLFVWAIATVRLWRRHPVASIGLGWALLFFLPVSNVLFMATTAYGERLLYLPAAGLAVAVGVFVEGALRAVGRPWLVWSLLAIWLLANGVAIQMRHGDWRSPETLARAGLENEPRSALVLQQNAMVEILAGNNVAGEDLARRSIAVWPRYGYAYKALGVALANQGKTAEAEAAFRHAIDLLPQADIYSDWAIFLARQKRFAEAREAVHAGLRIDPSYRPLRETEAALERLPRAARTHVP
jgi:tetratricopeptide (TPR) repeat protein